MRTLNTLLLLFTASLSVAIGSAQSPIPLLSVPQDFNSPALSFQEFSVDTGTFAPLVFAGIQNLGNGDIINTGPTYTDPSFFFPYIALDSSRNILLLHPGTFSSVRTGAVLGATIANAGSYDIAGAFARANDFQNSGDGVRVVVFVNSDIGHPVFDAAISSNNAVNPNSPFAGTGVAAFHMTVRLAAGDMLRFAVFSGPTLTDGTFDVTALQATITSLCQPGAVPCITSPQDGAHPQSQFAAISGTGTPRDTLNVLVGGFSVGQVQVDSEGNWEALPYVSPFGSSVTVQVQDQTTSNSSNTITVHPSLAFFPSPLPASYYARLLPLRKADIFIDGDISSPQVTLYGATYTHTALYLGGDSDGTPWLAEAVTAQEAGIWGQVRSVLLEQSLVWKANRVSAWRPFSPLSAATRSAIVNWASTITTQGLPYWSKAEIVGLPAAADTMYLAALPARLNLFLNAIYALTNSTSTFICSTLVWRAYYEGTGHALDISQPNLMTAQPGSLLGTFSPGFISLLSHAPVGCTGWCGSVFMVPETFVRSGKLSQIF